jgi:hypothetical protein
MNTFYFDTTTASIFVAGTTVIFIPVVTVYYCRVNAFNCLGRCLAMDVCSDSDIRALWQHATIFKRAGLLAFLVIQYK